jgi:molecular chaperone GrpE
MHTAYDPWGRRAAAQTVPLQTALALRDEARRALARVDELRADNRDLREALARGRTALNELRAESEALREELRLVKHDLDAVLQERADTEEVPSPEETADEPHPLEAQLAELRADLANLRRHRDEAVDRARREGEEAALLPLADALDDLDRALLDTHDGALAEGLRALHTRLSHRLSEAGVHRFTQRGDRFDPARHEAIALADGPDGEIVALERHGLARGDGSVIRPAHVVVGSGRAA